MLHTHISFLIPRHCPLPSALLISHSTRFHFWGRLLVTSQIVAGLGCRLGNRTLCGRFRTLLPRSFGESLAKLPSCPGLQGRPGQLPSHTYRVLAESTFLASILALLPSPPSSLLLLTVSHWPHWTPPLPARAASSLVTEHTSPSRAGAVSLSWSPQTMHRLDLAVVVWTFPKEPRSPPRYSV